MFKSYLKLPVSAAKQSQRQRPEITESHPELEGPHRAHRVQLLEVAAAASNRALGTAPRYRLQKRHHQMRVAQLPGIHILASGLLSADRLHFPIRAPTGISFTSRNGDGGSQRDCRPEQARTNREPSPKTTSRIGSKLPRAVPRPPMDRSVSSATGWMRASPHQTGGKPHGGSGGRPPRRAYP